MTQFTILHRGVPIGSAGTTPRPDAEPDDPFEFSFLDSRPSPAYEAVRPVIQLASDALAHFGFLGPIADPESDSRGRAAYVAAQAVWGELELADDSGRPVAGRVVWFLEHIVSGEPSYWLDVELDDTRANVPAGLRVPPHDGPAYNRPRPNVR
jgi:hypothetical protein